MTLRHYSGRLYYDGNEYLDVLAFIVRDKEIAFSLASVTQEHGRWDAESGRTAILQPDGSYLARQVQAHNGGVAADFPWDITFHITYEDLAKTIKVSGTLVEGEEPYEFEGELDAKSS